MNLRAARAHVCEGKRGKKRKKDKVGYQKPGPEQFYRDFNVTLKLMGASFY
jgi:hypothetical protein